MKRPHILWFETFAGRYVHLFAPLRRYLSRGDWRQWHSRWRFRLYCAWARRAYWAVEDESVYEWMRKQEAA